MDACSPCLLPAGHLGGRVLSCPAALPDLNHWELETWSLGMQVSGHSRKQDQGMSVALTCGQADGDGHMPQHVGRQLNHVDGQGHQCCPCPRPLPGTGGQVLLLPVTEGAQRPREGGGLAGAALLVPTMSACSPGPRPWPTGSSDSPVSPMSFLPLTRGDHSKGTASSPGRG